MHKHTPQYRSEGKHIHIVYDVTTTLFRSQRSSTNATKSHSRKSAFKAFPRIIRSPSKKPPKSSAPSWAVRPDYSIPVSPNCISSDTSTSIPLSSVSCPSTPGSSTCTTPNPGTAVTTPISSSSRPAARPIQLYETLIDAVVSSDSDSELDLV